MSEPASPPLATLDHVGFVGADLGRLVAAMRRLGFATTEPRELMRVDPATGAAIPLRQQSCHAVLGEGYLEFTAVTTDDPGHHLAAYRARDEGLHIAALGSDRLDADRDRCVSAGLPCTGVADATRRIEYGSRHGEARFRWFMLEPAASPEGLLCFAHNLTPGLVFQPEVSVHPNGAAGLCELIVQHASPATAAARFAAVTANAGRAPSPGAGDGTGGLAGEDARRFPLARGAALALLSPAAMRARFGAAAVEGVPVGRFAGVQLRVPQLPLTEDWLRSRGVDCERRGPELVVPAHAACGAVLAFRE